jgi:hypothetical protein
VGNSKKLEISKEKKALAGRKGINLLAYLYAYVVGYSFF